MIYYPEIQAIAQEVVTAVPHYAIQAVDINEALDTGWASCSVRAFLAGLSIEDTLDLERLDIKFGFEEATHGELGESGRHYGHAALGLWAGGEQRILDSYDKGEMEIVRPSDAFICYSWFPLDEGYERYLDRLGAEVVVDRDDISRILHAKTRGKILV